MYGWLLVGAAACLGYVLIKKTKRFWVKLLFPIGYYLYTTRVGYHFHLHQLSKKSPTPHSITQPLSLSGFTVVSLAILGDNYCYVVVDDTSKIAVAVDPADPEAVMRYVEEKNLTLKAVLTTHKHWDHSGGNGVLKKQIRDLAVYGGAKDHVPASTHLVQDKDIIKIGKLTFEAIWTPGHTLASVMYACIAMEITKKIAKCDTTHVGMSSKDPSIVMKLSYSESGMLVRVKVRGWRGCLLCSCPQASAAVTLVPCHVACSPEGLMAGHIVYVLQSSPLCVFTGDHLFVGGTGKMFECNAETMVRSIKKITQLPHNSLLFPGHEYTWQNLKFINSLQGSHISPSTLEQSSVDVKNKLHWVSQQRARRLATIPAILSEELRYSPYLQTGRSSVKELVGLSQQASEDQVLAELRCRKNAFKLHT